MSLSKLVPIASEAKRNELGTALINPDPGLSNAVVLDGVNGAQAFLPTYRSATQSVGGAEAFSMRLGDDGTLQVFLQAGAPPPIASKVGAAKAHLDGTSFGLTLKQDRGATRIPVPVRDQGGNNIWLASVRLDGDVLKLARTMLFDSSPNAFIEVTQTVRMAAPLSETFVTQNWSNEAIKSKLLDTFAGIPIDSAAKFYRNAKDAAAMRGDDYASEFMLLDCTYTEQVALPTLPGFVQWPITWNGRVYNYYQDNQERSRVFFLPDRFEIAVGPTGAAAVSLLQLSIPEGGGVEGTQATFRVFGRPVVEFERIDHAKRYLREKIGPATDLASLQDARGVSTTFTQSLPSASGNTSQPQIQGNAHIDLSAGLRNEVSLTFAAFQAVWAAIFSENAENPLFLGWVDVKLSGGRYADQVSFNARLPKQQEGSFFDTILDQSLDREYSTTLTVKTYASIFANVANPTDEVLELSLTFGPNAIVTVAPPATGNKAKLLENSVEVRRSIYDIVLGNQNAGVYDYALRVARGDGTVARSDLRSQESTIYVTPALVNACR
jgi:hypothetical protein